MQPLPSLQRLPSPATGFEHVPVSLSQVPTLWHWSDAPQTTGVAPVQTPVLQLSIVVHLSPSSHAVASAALATPQEPAVQVLTLQAAAVPQSATVTQPTHAPLPSHLSEPPAMPHAVLTATGVWVFS